MAQEDTGAVRVSLDERGPGAVRSSVALVGRHVVRWLWRKMSSNWSLKRRGGLKSRLTISTKMLTWDSYYYDDDRRCAYMINGRTWQPHGLCCSHMRHARGSHYR